ncbi:MAG: sigma-54-dependent transcriptional regulator, partial [Bacillota bacterium]
MDKNKLKILVVDDEKSFRKVLIKILNNHPYIIDEAKNYNQAMGLIKKNSYDLVLTDLVMKDKDGLYLLKDIKNYDDCIEVIVVTGYGSIETAVEAMKKGAFSYYIKSKPPDVLLKEVKRVKDLKLNQKIFKKEKFCNEDYMLESEDEQFNKMLKIAKKASRSDINVLILGESGVGKEVIAKYIHLNSKRKEEVFLPVNCHAYSKNLLESELFGHEKGSFTGANEKKLGKFELANKGTLFLDEVGELSNDMQVKLLRTLENKEIERVGGISRIKLDFKLICATNVDLLNNELNDFREDLYYRISTVVLKIPPLRKRKCDLEKLIHFFVVKFSEKMDIDIKRIDKSVYNYLLDYDYPGNIRELKNIIERLVALSDDGIITKDILFINNNDQNTNGYKSLKDFRSNIEKKYIKKIIVDCAGNITNAAKILGISRRQLYNKIDQYNIK